MTDGQQLFILAACLIMIGFAFMGGVSEEDIQKCMASTNYGHERCLTEIMR